MPSSTKARAKEEKVLRGNSQSTFTLMHKSDLAPRDARKGTKFVKRQREENEAPAPYAPEWTGKVTDPYTAPELKNMCMRPGAMDFKSIKSRGIGA